MRRPALRLYGPAAGAGAADLGTVHLGERIPRSRNIRHSLQLVPVPGELLRPRAFRVDARKLDRADARPDRSLCGEASQARVRGVRLRLHLQAGTRGAEGGRSGLDRRPRDALAEWILSRQSFRMAGAD